VWTVQGEDKDDFFGDLALVLVDEFESHIGHIIMDSNLHHSTTQGRFIQGYVEALPQQKGCYCCWGRCKLSTSTHERHMSRGLPGAASSMCLFQLWKPGLGDQCY